LGTSRDWRRPHRFVATTATLTAIMSGEFDIVSWIGELLFFLISIQSSEDATAGLEAYIDM
jgi:hypothetical protein